MNEQPDEEGSVAEASREAPAIGPGAEDAEFASLASNVAFSSNAPTGPSALPSGKRERFDALFQEAERAVLMALRQAGLVDEKRHGGAGSLEDLFPEDSGYSIKDFQAHTLVATEALMPVLTATSGGSPESDFIAIRDPEGAARPVVADAPDANYSGSETALSRLELTRMLFMVDAIARVIAPGLDGKEVYPEAIEHAWQTPMEATSVGERVDLDAPGLLDEALPFAPGFPWEDEAFMAELLGQAPDSPTVGEMGGGQ